MHIILLVPLTEAVLDSTDGLFLTKRDSLVDLVEKGEVSVDWRPDPTQPLANANAVVTRDMFSMNAPG